MRVSGQRAEVEIAERLSDVLRAFLETHPASQLLEAGEVLFDLGTASYELDETGGRTLLHLWSGERNLVRRIVAATRDGGVLRLSTLRMGQKSATEMELVAAQESLRPVPRVRARQRFTSVLARVLGREFPEWMVESMRSGMDLEHSFGPAFVRGVQVRGQRAWACVGISAAETAVVVDGVLSVGILWLARSRERAGARRLVTGLRLVVPAGMAATTRARLAWMDERIASYELYEFDEAADELRRCDPRDSGNLTTRLIRAPDEGKALAPDGRFTEAMPRVLALLPAMVQPAESGAATGYEVQLAGRGVELRLRSSAELAFLRHGLEFARIRLGYGGQGFNRLAVVTVGSGASETVLTDDNADVLREMVGELFRRRSAMARQTVAPSVTAWPRSAGRAYRANGEPRTSWPGERPAERPAAAPTDSQTDPLFRLQPERWLEGLVRAQITAVDAMLCAEPVYVQVGALAGANDRGMLDLLAVTKRHRLAVLEVKTEEDLHMAMQGLDYWIRVQHHHLANVDASTGLGDLQRQGYFPATRLSSELPVLFLVAPALHIHSATELILRHLHPAVEWHLIALDERWRTRLQPVWRRRSGDREPPRERSPRA